MSEKNTNDSKSNDANIDYGILNDAIGYLIRRSQIKIFQEFNRHFEALEIKPAQFSALEIINRNPGLRQSALANALGVQRTNMVGMLDALQERGLIDRKLSNEDKRSHALFLTRKGQQLLGLLYDQFNQHEKQIEETIGQCNVEVFRECLSKIAHKLDSSDI